MFEASTLKLSHLRISSDWEKGRQLKWTEIMMRQWYAASLQVVTKTDRWARSLTDDDDKSQRQAAPAPPQSDDFCVPRTPLKLVLVRTIAGCLCKKSGRSGILKALCTFIWRAINTRVRSYICSSSPDPEPLRHFEGGERGVHHPCGPSLQASSCHISSEWAAVMWAD